MTHELHTCILGRRQNERTMSNFRWIILWSLILFEFCLIVDINYGTSNVSRSHPLASIALWGAPGRTYNLLITQLCLFILFIKENTKDQPEVTSLAIAVARLTSSRLTRLTKGVAMSRRCDLTSQRHTSSKNQRLHQTAQQRVGITNRYNRPSTCRLYMLQKSLLPSIADPSSG
jgi:hypothetical protein